MPTVVGAHALVFVSFAAFGAAVDNGIVQGGALALLALVLVWLGRRIDRDGKKTAGLEGENKVLRETVAELRVLKHDAISAAGAEKNRYLLLRNAVRAGDVDMANKVIDFMEGT